MSHYNSQLNKSNKWDINNIANYECMQHSKIASNSEKAVPYSHHSAVHSPRYKSRPAISQRCSGNLHKPKSSYPKNTMMVKRQSSCRVSHFHFTAPLSRDDLYRKTIADDNKKIVLSNQFRIEKSRYIDDQKHLKIQKSIFPLFYGSTIIHINECSTIAAAISYNEKHTGMKKICILNFASSTKPGGGYLNGRGAQEETLCRQTLLYPTLKGSFMYTFNKSNGSKPEGSDSMIYSPNVHVIRDDNYNRIRPFTVNVISSPAVDNRSGNIHHSKEIMENRIRKIILLAAAEKNDVLILGAFGCGVFKNDPFESATIFKKILVDEGFKNHFDSVIFPIYKNPRLYTIFNSVFNKSKKQ